MTQSPLPSPTPVSRWQPLRPILQRIGYWLNGLSTIFFLSWFSGRLLGHCYPFELFSHFQVQYFYTAFGLLGLYLLRRLVYDEQDRSLFVLIPFSLLAIIIILDLKDDTWVPGDYPSNLFGKPGEVRVFHANVLYTRADYEPTLTLLRRQQPDLYVLQEMTPESIRLVTARLRTEFPHWFACWSKGPCWILVGSRTPIRVDTALVRQQRIIALTTRVGGRAMSLVTVHPRTPLLPSWFRERNEQLSRATRLTRDNALPTVLIGDFNITMFSPVYKAIFGEAGKASGGNARSLQSGRDKLTQPTWPRYLPPVMLPIDHAFTNGGFWMPSFRTLDHPGSDHRAVVVDLAFMP